MPKRFLTRKKGTDKQKGQKFPLLEKKKLPPRIKITKTARHKIPNFQWADTDLSDDVLNTATEIQFTDMPKEIQDKVKPFLNMQDPEDIHFFKGYYQGAPFYHITDPFAVGTIIRKQVARTKEESKALKKRRKKERKEIAKERIHKEIADKVKSKKQTAVQALALAKRMPFFTKKDLAILEKMAKKEIKAKKKKIPKKTTHAKRFTKEGQLYKQYLADMGMKKAIAKKVKAVKYPASQRGPSYQRYLAKLREKRRLAKLKKK
jgi:hypothetical protein